MAGREAMGVYQLLGGANLDQNLAQQMLQNGLNQGWNDPNAVNLNGNDGQNAGNFPQNIGILAQMSGQNFLQSSQGRQIGFSPQNFSSYNSQGEAMQNSPSLSQSGGYDQGMYNLIGAGNSNSSMSQSNSSFNAMNQFAGQNHMAQEKLSALARALGLNQQGNMPGNDAPQSQFSPAQALSQAQHSLMQNAQQSSNDFAQAQLVQQNMMALAQLQAQSQIQNQGGMFQQSVPASYAASQGMQNLNGVQDLMNQLMQRQSVTQGGSFQQNPIKSDELGAFASHIPRTDDMSLALQGIFQQSSPQVRMDADSFLHQGAHSLQLLQLQQLQQAQQMQQQQMQLQQMQQQLQVPQQLQLQQEQQIQQLMQMQMQASVQQGQQGQQNLQPQLMQQHSQDKAYMALPNQFQAHNHFASEQQDMQQASQHAHQPSMPSQSAKWGQIDQKFHKQGEVSASSSIAPTSHGDRQQRTVSTAPPQDSLRRDQVFVSNGQFNITMASSDDGKDKNKTKIKTKTKQHEKKSNEKTGDELDNASSNKEKKHVKKTKDNEKPIKEAGSAKEGLPPLAQKPTEHKSVNGLVPGEGSTDEGKQSAEPSHEAKGNRDDGQEVEKGKDKSMASTRHEKDRLAAFVSAGTLKSSMAYSAVKDEEGKQANVKQDTTNLAFESSQEQEAADGRKEQANRKRKEDSESKERKKAKKAKMKAESGDKEDDGHGGETEEKKKKKDKDKDKEREKHKDDKSNEREKEKEKEKGNHKDKEAADTNDKKPAGNLEASETAGGPVEPAADGGAGPARHEHSEDSRQESKTVAFRRKVEIVDDVDD
mmetsp:Transcript_12091/g.27932  ORF Transcript_12091/g.27932 Transcript_12091/m.27932 type:complete len:816 (-) Transcript_12091:4631-7078(-)